MKTTEREVTSAATGSAPLMTLAEFEATGSASPVLLAGFRALVHMQGQTRRRTRQEWQAALSAFAQAPAH